MLLYIGVYISFILFNRGGRKGYEGNVIFEEDRRRSVDDLLDNNEKDRGGR